MHEILAPPYKLDAMVRELAAKVRVVVFDVDGVLTDGKLLMDDDGKEYKAFHSRDGHGIKMLQRTGVEIGIITGRTSRLVERRVTELGIKHVFQGCEDKLPVFQGLLAKLRIEPAQAAFLGDDVTDLPIMLKAGLAVAVSDGHTLVKHYAHWVTPSSGGQGAVRELCEVIMHAQGTYVAEIQRYL
ncbi:MAG: KdsC family phosphatase [Acidiferrobacterales bacterium]